MWTAIGMVNVALLLTTAQALDRLRGYAYSHNSTIDALADSLTTGRPHTAALNVYHRDQFLCRAVAPDIAAATISMQNLQAARNERRRELREHLTARRSLAELLNARRPAAVPPAGAKPITPPASTKPRPKLYRDD